MLLMPECWSLVPGYHFAADSHCVSLACHDHCPWPLVWCPHSSPRWSLVTAADWKIETERAWRRGRGSGQRWADCWGRGELGAGDQGRGLVPDIPGSQGAHPDPALTAEVRASSVQPQLHRGEAQATSDPPPSRGQAASLRPCQGGLAASCRDTAGPCPGDKADACSRDQALAFPALRGDSLRVLACLDGASCTCQPCLGVASGRVPACLDAADIPGVRDISAFPDWDHCVGPQVPGVPVLMMGERRGGGTATAAGTGACSSPAWRGTEES